MALIQIAKKFLFFAIWFPMATTTLAQIAPECVGVEIPSDYNEEKQRAFMQNFFVSLLSSKFEASNHPSEDTSHVAAARLTYIPKLSCAQRLALNGTKTEETTKTPILPALSLNSRIFSHKIFSIDSQLSFLPPIPLKHFQLSTLNTSLMFSIEAVENIAFHLNSFLSLAYLRAEIAGPFSKEDEIKDDWFSFSSFGADLGWSFIVPLSLQHRLLIYNSLGFIKANSVFVIGDDSLSIPNETYPLKNLRAFVGFNYKWDKVFQIDLSLGGTPSYVMTAFLSLGFPF